MHPVTARPLAHAAVRRGSSHRPGVRAVAVLLVLSLTAVASEVALTLALH